MLKGPRESFSTDDRPDAAIVGELCTGANRDGHSGQEGHDFKSGKGIAEDGGPDLLAGTWNDQIEDSAK